MSALLSLLDTALIKIGLGVLIVWWAVWSLFDQYLLPLTPWSEIVLLGLGVSLIVVGDCRLCCLLARSPSVPVAQELQDEDEESGGAEGTDRAPRRKKKTTAVAKRAGRTGDSLGSNLSVARGTLSLAALDEPSLIP